MDEILNTQKRNLVVAIKEAELREKHRLMRLTQVKDPHDHKKWFARFTRERQMDQERIECLSNDVTRLKEKLVSGEITNKLIQERKTAKLDADKIANMPLNWPNRFSGVEDRDGEVFHLGMIQKFELHDQMFKAKQAFVPFDKVKEVKKLRLLDQKRQVLQKLINVQSAVNQGNFGDNMTVDSRRTFNPPTSITFNNRRPFDVQSIRSDNTGVSTLTYATYATFATQNQTHPRATQSANSNNSKRNLPPIPRLNLTSSR